MDVRGSENDDIDTPTKPSDDLTDPGEDLNTDEDEIAEDDDKPTSDTSDDTSATSGSDTPTTSDDAGETDGQAETPAEDETDVVFSQGLFTEFPAIMAFRSSNADDYTPLSDDIAVFHDENLDILEAISTEGESLAIMRSSHFSISNNQREQVKACYFLYAVGDFVKSSVITTTQTEITLKTVDHLKEGDHATLFYFDRDKREVLCDSQFEEVVISKINTSTKKVTVERGQFATDAQKWSTLNYDVYLAPHVMTWDNVPNSWSVNPYSAWEFYVDYTINEVIYGKYEGKPHGVEFDGGRFGFKDTKTKVDINLDGVADYGYLDGINVYGLYSVKFYEKLRSKLPDLIIQVDSSIVQWGYRSYSDINGIEMENYLDGEDFSAAFTHLQQWTENTDGEQMAFSYPVTKENTKTFFCDGSTVTDNKNFRLGLASSLLVGMPHAFATENAKTGTKCFNFYKWDEYYGGDLQTSKWLGAPLSEALSVVDEDTENLFSNASWNQSVGDESYQISFTNGDNKKLLVKQVPQEVIELDSGAFYPGITGAGFIGTLPKGSALKSDDQFIVSFKASAVNTYPSAYAFAKNKKIPRLLRVKVATAKQGQGRDILVSPTQKEYTLSFSFDEAATIKNVSFWSGEEAGTLQISDIKVVAGQGQRWVRYFENGAVLVNPTKSNWTVTLDKSLYKNIEGFQRLLGKQDKSINSGAVGDGEDKNQFTIPAGDALLVKTF